MTSRTARHHFLASDLVFRLQFRAFFGCQIIVLPLHVKYLGFRSDEFFRLAVTGQAPFHLKSVFLKYRRHIVDLAVTRRTTDALCYVDAVIEICKFGKIVNTLPFDRLIFAEAGTHGLQIRAVGPYLAVAIHTSLRRRHSGRCCRLHRRVAIPAIDSVVADVMLVAKLDRLLLLQIPAREIRGAGHLRVDKKSNTAENHYRQHRDLGDVICAFIEELCHFINLLHPAVYKKLNFSISQVFRETLSR